MSITAVVDATVPTDWLPSFIGHQVWSKGQWAQLLEVWIEAGPDQNCWLSRRRAVRDAKGTRVEACARNSFVQAVPEDECELVHLEENTTIWEWAPPGYGDFPAPSLPVRPQGWRPPATPPQPIDITPPTHDQGDEYALFTL